jgi:transposase
MGTVDYPGCYAQSRQSRIEEEAMLANIHHASTEQTATVRADLTLYASLELSRATWLVTCLSPERERMSRYSTPGGDGGALLGLLERMQARAQQLTGRPVKIVVIQEAGLDGFWVHRLLEANGIESHVVDPASIAVPRRRRRAKTDAIDGETLLRTLLAWTRLEPRVCAMVVPPTPEEEDCRRVCRERAILLQERIRHTNRIKGLLAGHGITGFNPLHKDRRQLLDAARTGDGRPLPRQLKAESLREIELIELLLRQIADVAAREVLAGPKGAKVPPRSFSSSSSKASVRRSPQSCTSRASSEASAIAASWQPMRGSRQHRGGAARSTRSKAYPKRVIGVCVAL